MAQKLIHRLGNAAVYLQFGHTRLEMVECPGMPCFRGAQATPDHFQFVVVLRTAELGDGGMDLVGLGVCCCIVDATPVLFEDWLEQQPSRPTTRRLAIVPNQGLTFFHLSAGTRQSAVVVQVAFSIGKDNQYASEIGMLMDRLDMETSQIPQVDGIREHQGSFPSQIGHQSLAATAAALRCQHDGTPDKVLHAFLKMLLWSCSTAVAIRSIFMKGSSSNSAGIRTVTQSPGERLSPPLRPVTVSFLSGSCGETISISQPLELLWMIQGAG
jgi:hypothetical protein